MCVCVCVCVCILSICLSSFISHSSTSGKLNLNSHLVSHSTARPHQCIHCGSFFKRTSTLNAHVQALHTGRRYHCPICQKEFTQKVSEYCAYADQVQCCLGMVSFDEVSVRLSHGFVLRFGEQTRARRIRPAIRFKDMLRRHRNAHKQGTIPDCRQVRIVRACVLHLLLCVLQTHIRNHMMRIHTHEKPIQCPYCPKRFTTRWDVKNHAGKMHKDKIPDDDPYFVYSLL